MIIFKTIKMFEMCIYEGRVVTLTVLNTKEDTQKRKQLLVIYI